LTELTAYFDRARSQIKAEREQVEWERSKHVNTIAARKTEAIWRRKMAPCCPHCNKGNLPEDGFGAMAISRDMAIAERVP
jgi:hypothetical protein